MSHAKLNLFGWQFSEGAVLSLEHCRLVARHCRVDRTVIRSRAPLANSMSIAPQAQKTPSRDLDDTGPGRQTLLHDPKLLSSRPPPSPLRSG
jgi:hypothetical protein